MPGAAKDGTDDGVADDVTAGTASTTDRARAMRDGASEWVLRALARYPRPARPLTAEWEISIAGLVRTVPFVPRFAAKPLELLDGLGAVHVGPEKVGFDGDAVPWDRVLEVRTEPLVSSISAEALEQGISQMTARLPLLPGRSWLGRRLSEVLYTLYLVANPVSRAELREMDAELGGAEDPYGADPDPTSPEHDGRTVTQIVVRKRLGSSAEQATSVTGVLLQIAVPGATEAIVHEARARKIPVVHVPVEEGAMGLHVQRAESWRSAAGTVRARLAGLRGSEEGDDAEIPGIVRSRGPRRDEPSIPGML